MEINVLLKEKRTEHQMTQEELAAKIFVSKKTISNWETGRTTPDIDSLIRLARIFDLSLDALLLEGSDLVENIKTRGEMNQSIKLISLNSVVNLILNVFLSVTQRFFGQLSMVAEIVIFLIWLNILVLDLYLLSRLKRWSGRNPDELRKERKQMLWFIIIMGILYLAFVLWLISTR